MNLLGAMAPEVFLTQYWQSKALFLPGVCEDTNLVTGDELAGLALEPEIESRLVQAEGQGYTLRSGPFDEADFAGLAEQDWTLLVQSVDLFIPAVATLKDAVTFLPSWRVDDVMVSFAVPGGGVGPHFDFYDVFLVQLQGEREWRLGQHCDADTPIDSESGLKLLRKFDEQVRYVAQPGDVLYVPPGVAHWGTAVSEGLTASVGFRAPTRAELLADLATELMATHDLEYYRDPVMGAVGDGDAMTPQHIEQLSTMLHQLAEDKERLGDWFARYMTAPRYSDLLDDTGEHRSATLGERVYVNGSPVVR